MIDLRSISHLSNPLPRVLPTVCEEYVCGCNFVAAVVVVSAVDGWELGHIELREDQLAVCEPVVVVDEF